MPKTLLTYINEPIEKLLNSIYFRNAFSKYMCCSGTSGGIQSIVGGTDITVDNTDPSNPIINYTGSGGGFYQTVQRNLADQPQRSKLNFSDQFFASDNLGNDSTDVQISSLSWSFIIDRPTTLSGYGITDAWDVNGNNANSSNILGTINTIPLNLYTDSVKRMTILANGKILVNTTIDPGNYQFWSESNSNVGIGAFSDINYAGYFTSGNTSIQPTLYILRNNTSANIAEFYSPLQSVKLTALGSIQASALAGTGNRMVIADSTGLLSTQTIPISGITGSGTTNYHSKWSSSTNLTNSLIFDNGTSLLVGTTTANASALLSLVSTTQGFLKPKGTTTQKNAIPSPSIGLEFYDTSLNAPGFYSGSIWTGSWNRNGNSGTTPGTDYIGTSDDKDLIFKRNNVFSGILNSASYNTSFGVNAMNATATGTFNTSFGAGAMSSLTSAADNVAIGVNAMFYTTTGGNNVAVGKESLLANTIGSANTMLGWRAGYLTTNYSNVAVGYQALMNNTTGSFNTVIGTNAGSNITTGSQNLIIGYNSSAVSTTNNGQVNIQNLIWGVNATGTGTTEAGFVGIGINTPTDRLHVVGTTKSTNIYTTSAAPIPTLGTGAGSGSPTVTFAAGSTNQAGKITVVTGTSPAANATFLTLVFSGSFTAPNGSVMILTPVNDNACNIIGNGVGSLKTDSTATNNVVATTGTIAPTASTTYIFAYHILHY